MLPPSCFYSSGSERARQQTAERHRSRQWTEHARSDLSSPRSSSWARCSSRFKPLISPSPEEAAVDGGREGEHGSEEAAGVRKRKHNHISSQTNASLRMEMDGGSAFQSRLEIPPTTTTRLQVLALSAAAARAKHLDNESERKRQREKGEMK